MKILIFPVAIFILAVAVHLVIWKISFPLKHRILILINIFAWVLVFGIIILPDFSQSLEFIVLYCSLGAAYLLSYPAIEADSPSLAITYNIAQTASAGLVKAELNKMMDDDILVVARINDLLSEGLVCLRSGKYYLTPSGLFLAGLFSGFRKLLNLPKGG